MIRKLFIYTSVFVLFKSQCYSQNLQWARGYGSNGIGESSSSITLDASGNVYTTGYFWGTVDFDPGPGSFTLTSGGNTDIYVQKLDASGNFLWAGRMGGVADDNGNSIAVDGSGNMYITGMFSTLADFDPGPGTFSMPTPGGSYDAFIVKLNAAGALVWAKQMGGTGSDEGFGVFLDLSGDVYTTGKFQNTGDFDPGIGTANLTSAGSSDVFVQKLTSAGIFAWAKSMGGAASDQGQKLFIDGFGNVFLTGWFQAIADFDPGITTANLTSSGLEDIFVAKLDASGNYVWARQLGGPGTDKGLTIDLDAGGNVYTSGSFSGIADMDPGLTTSNLISNGLEDIFISKLNSTGTFVWATQAGGTLNDKGSSVYADASNVYLVGEFSGTVDFDPGTGTSNLNSSAGGSAFILKLNQSGNYMWAINFGGTNALSHAHDAAGVIHITGVFGGTADMDPGTGVTNLTSSGTEDVYVMKLNPLALGLNENSDNADVRFFPNPMANNLVVDLGKEYSEVKIEILDALGKLVFSQSKAVLCKTEIEFKEVPGIYFMTISASEFKKTIKLIKE